MNSPMSRARVWPYLLVASALLVAGLVAWYGPQRIKHSLVQFAVEYSQGELETMVGSALPIPTWRDLNGHESSPEDEPSRATIAFVSVSGCSACEALGEFLVFRQAALSRHHIEVRVLMGARSTPPQALPAEWVRRVDDDALLEKLRGLAYPTVYFLNDAGLVESVQTGFSRQLVQEWIDGKSVDALGGS